MKKIFALFLTALLLCLTLSACGTSTFKVKIGVSMGVGQAERWEKEKVFMEKRAATLGADIEVRLNKTDKPKTQLDDCVELIDSGVQVLIVMPRDVSKVSPILEYAAEKNVPVISYARVILGAQYSLFVGYDSSRIGQKMGQYLTESVYEGDYLVFSGDPNDNNATLLYEGAMRYIDEIKGSINVILDAPVPGWSADEAKRLALDAIAANNNSVDAILAPNDKIAGVCAEVLAELGITNKVFLTGMDADLDAVKRIVAGTQDMTIYMDLQELASTAIDEACRLAKGEAPNANAEFDNQSEKPVPASLITGQIVTKENLDKILIDSGYYTREEVYGKSE